VIVYKEYYINSARFLPKLDSSHICSNLHGHTYNIKVSVKGPVNPNTGFVIDAFDIDKYFAKVHKEIDHKLLNEIKGLENPTSENICVFVWNRLIKYIPNLHEIEIKENNVTGFIYSGD
tara:strand:+ start:1158 stop:1514 length:357 start_codon:yes stop_codon:yes gene_type:complete